MKDDYYSNDVEGAAGFQKYHNSDDIDNDSDADYGESEEPDEFDDDCNCSDPGCPCGGYKKGGV